jgi:hypothetical protein
MSDPQPELNFNYDFDEVASELEAKGCVKASGDCRMEEGWESISMTLPGLPKIWRLRRSQAPSASPNRA